MFNNFDLRIRVGLASGALRHGVEGLPGASELPDGNDDEDEQEQDGQDGQDDPRDDGGVGSGHPLHDSLALPCSARRKTG